MGGLGLFFGAAPEKSNPIGLGQCLRAGTAKPAASQHGAAPAIHLQKHGEPEHAPGP